MKNTNINLNKKEFTKYFNDDIIIYIHGYAFLNNKLYKEVEFSNLFNNVYDMESFYQVLNKLNGLYTVVIQLKDKLLIAVDLLRTYPIFYTELESEFNVSDQPYGLLEEHKLFDFNKAKIEEFKTLSFTTLNSTVMKNLSQLDSGQCLMYDSVEDKLKTQYYNYYATDKINSSSINDLYHQAFSVSINVFKRLIKSINNKTIVVPLSGGYDSRYIVSMLKELEYENVICFTYGRKDSYEVQLSQKVATELQYPWFFVEYNNTLVQEYLNQKEFKECMLYSSKLTSVPHFQDYIAVKYLQDNHIIPTDSIFVPGHSGDLLGGSHLRSMLLDFKMNKFTEIQDLSATLYEYWYNYNEFNTTTHININLYKEDIKSFYKDFKVSDFNYISYITDSWNIANRQAKFIVNSCQVYKYFNYDFRLPLFDREMVAFWFSIEPKHRTNRILYNEFLLNKVFIKHNIDFSKKNTHSSIKHRLRKLIGIRVYSKLKKYLKSSKSDINNFDFFIKFLLDEINMDEKYLSSHIDHVSAIWYIKILSLKLEQYKNAKQ